MSAMGKDGSAAGGWVTQLMRGVVELVILNLLDQGESYGYELTRRCGDLPWLGLKEATLYQVLNRLKDSGALKTRQERTSRLRKRTYFSLTAAGKRQVAEMNHHFDGMVEQINQLRQQGDS